MKFKLHRSSSSSSSSSSLPVFLFIATTVLTFFSPNHVCHSFSLVPVPARQVPSRLSKPETCLSLARQEGGSSSPPPRIDKGFNLLELASQVVPQGRIVQTAKESWKFAWKRMMTELAPQDQTGNYQRPKYSFGNTIGSRQYPIEAGRYHVYVGNPCPWCHRVRLVVNLLGLTTKVGSSTVTSSASLLEGMTVLVDDPIKASRGGWILPNGTPSQLTTKGTTTRSVPPINDLRALYDYLSPGYQGRCTAPLLVDWKTQTIVSNESSDIVRMLPLLLQAEDKGGEENADDDTSITNNVLCPPELQELIDETNQWVYKLLNNGVYRCGFSTSQVAYNAATKDVLDGLSKCEMILSKQKFLCSNIQLTESDIMLLPTMLRYDGVYSPLFSAGGKHVRLQCDYPNIFAWLKRCWNLNDNDNNNNGIGEGNSSSFTFESNAIPTSIDITDACMSYYKQLFPLHPGGILPTPVTAKSLHLEE